MILVIVESPTKAQTIKHYLGSNYLVLASKGHIRDLATTGEGMLGIDIEDNFAPTYEIIPRQRRLIEYLKNLASKADEVILATDPDREGEAISWHIAETLGLNVNTTKRFEFHEVTRRGVEAARDNPRTINIALVESQETRRLLDRIIGFKLSGLLQKKIHSRSAGRVQSAALLIIVEREAAIQAFVPVTTYNPMITVKVGDSSVKAYLVDPKTDEDGKTSYQKRMYNTSEESDALIATLARTATLERIEVTARDFHSRPAYTTSTLQQDAFNFLRFTAKKTNRIAQRLYEGVNIGDETTGLITYMRTDSVRLSPLFIHSAKEFIRNEYGEEYVGFAKQRNSEGAQDAHEAIRPTYANKTPEAMKEYLNDDEYKLYRLIWHRAMASLMKAQQVEVTQALFNNAGSHFLATGQKLLFDGYLRLAIDHYPEYEALPALVVDETYKVSRIDSEKHVTSPPPRFTEARLIKTMEELGIGRPSTYATVIETLKSRSYVTLSKGVFLPSKQGVLTTEKLQEFFRDFVNVEYTAKMEQDLDLIAAGETTKVQVLHAFYDLFIQQVERAWSDMEVVEPEYLMEFLEEKCPQCGNPLVRRSGKSGRQFVGCSNFPKCKYIKPFETAEKANPVTCPTCKQGHLVRRRGPYGQFWGCSRYPECKYVSRKN